MTHEILLRIADAVCDHYPVEALRLRLVASNVEWLENRVNELVADEQDAQQMRERA